MNPVSIVDLRNNIHFNQTRNTPPVLAAASAYPLQHHDISSPPEPIQVSSGRHDLNISRNRASMSQLHPGITSMCDGCTALRARVAELESRLFMTSEKLVSFEYEVISILKGISDDVKEMKRQTNLSGMRSTSPNAGFSRLNAGNDTENNSFNFESSPGDARTAIAGACMALEQLIFEAKSMTSPNKR